jgi:hypothetical protein
MVKTNFILIAVVLVAIVLLSVSGTGAFIAQGTIKSVSSVTSPISNKAAFLVDMTGYGSVSKDLYPNWNSNYDVTFGIEKLNDSYTYTLTERVTANKYIYKYEIVKECIGDFNLFDTNMCYHSAQPWIHQPYTLVSDRFKAWCSSLGSGYVAYEVGTPELNDDLICYKQTPRWIIGDFNQVGGYYSPSVLITANVYPRGTQPWNTGDYTEVAETILTPASTTGSLVGVDSGVTLADVKILGMSPLFTTPPPQTDVRALSSVVSPRQWQLTGNVEAVLNAAQSNGGIAAQLQHDIQAAATSTAYNKAQLTNAYVVYNARIDQLPTYTNLTGQWASTPIDTSTLNSQNTIKIKNSFALPEVLGYFYTSYFQIVNVESTPFNVSCQDKTLSSGTSYNMPISTIFSSTPNGQTATLSLSCTSPISGGGTAGINPTTNPYTGYIQINTGSGGVSQCTVTASGNGVTKTGTCTITVNAACNNIIPTGCQLAPTPNDPCHVSCPVIPITCNDGTMVGQCNTLNQRCKNVSGTLSLFSDSTCTIIPPGGNNTTLTCLPIVQKINTQQVGATSFFGLTFGGTTVQSCVWDFPILAAVLLVVAGALLVMKKEKIAKVVGLVGLLLLVLSFVADNATLLALGGAGIFLIAAVAVVAYVALRLHLI